MKTILAIILITVIIIAGIQLYKLYGQNVSLQQKTSKLTADINEISDENSKLEADLKYFSNPANLEKELRARLNYKKPGEELMILIPPKEN